MVNHAGHAEGEDEGICRSVRIHLTLGSFAGMRSSIIIMVAAALGSVLAACNEPQSSTGRSLVAVASNQELMLAVIEPAAEVYWDAVGVIMDEEATHEIRPQTPEEWEEVENAAFVLAESGNLLMLEDRAEDRQPWLAMSQALIEVGRRAIEAARNRDPEAVFTVGGDVYQVCTACHAVYATETLRPNYEPNSSADESRVTPTP